MKKSECILYFICLILYTGCVQKTNQKTVIFLLEKNPLNNIDSIRLSGNDKPLQRDKETTMNTLVKDSLYTDTITFITGYTFTEVKFTINYKTGKPKEINRKIYFNKGDTTIFKDKIE